MAKKKTSKKRAASRGKKTRSRSVSLGGVSTEALTAELRRRERDIAKLEAKREKLLAQVDAVDAEIAELARALGAAAPIRSGRRPGTGKRFRNSMNLAEALHGVLKGKEMGVTEAAEAVQRAGYKTTAENFRVIVNQTLLKDKRFKKLARGIYTGV